MQAELNELRANMLKDLYIYFSEHTTDSINEDEVIFIVNSHFERHRLRVKNIL
tara:strand:- start:151 stop:309 length:159 start_codon:yes stop_codon:yes gene_type:complete